MNEKKKLPRTAAVVAGSILVAGSGLVAGAALASSASAADATASPSTTSSSATTSTEKPAPGQRIKDFMSSVLKDLVGKGTLTQAQSDAITAGIDAKVTADQALETQFRTKAEAIIAKAYGLTVANYRTALSQRTLPQLTAAQRTQLQTDLQALRTSLGLPADGDGFGRDGFGRGGRGHHGGGDFGGDFDGDGPDATSSGTNG